MGCSQSAMSNADGGVPVLKWRDPSRVHNHQGSDEYHEDLESDEAGSIDRRGSQLACSRLGCVHQRSGTTKEGKRSGGTSAARSDAARRARPWSSSSSGSGGSGGGDNKCRICASGGRSAPQGGGGGGCSAGGPCHRCDPSSARRRLPSAMGGASSSAVAVHAAVRAALSALRMPARIDLDEPHPSDPPFLGSSDWMPVTPRSGGRASSSPGRKMRSQSLSPRSSPEAGAESVPPPPPPPPPLGRRQYRRASSGGTSPIPTPVRRHRRDGSKGSNVSLRSVEGTPPLLPRRAEGTPPRHRKTPIISPRGGPSTSVPPLPFQFTNPSPPRRRELSPTSAPISAPSPVEALVDGKTPGGGAAHRPMSLHERLSMLGVSAGTSPCPQELNAATWPLPSQRKHPLQTTDPMELGQLRSLLSEEAASTPTRVPMIGRGNMAGEEADFAALRAARSGDTLLTSTTVSTDCGDRNIDYENDIDADGESRSTPALNKVERTTLPQTQHSRLDDDAMEANAVAGTSEVGVGGACAGEEEFTPRRLFDDSKLFLSPQKLQPARNENEALGGLEHDDEFLPKPSSSPESSVRYSAQASESCTLLRKFVGQQLCARGDDDAKHDTFLDISAEQAEGAGVPGGDLTGMDITGMDNSLLDTTPPELDRRDASHIMYNGVLVKGHIPTPCSIRSLATYPRGEQDGYLDAASRNTSLNTSFDLSRSGRGGNCDDDDNDEFESDKENREDRNCGSGRTGTKKMRHVSTLPSMERGRPIRLRVTESYAGAFSSSSGASFPPNDADHPPSSQAGAGAAGWTLSSADYSSQFSFDPFINSGRYTVTTPGGKPWGNGLTVDMGPNGYQTMSDRAGRLSAVTRSRHTYEPSHVVYSPRPRFVNQIPSSHRPPALPNGRAATTGVKFRHESGTGGSDDPGIVQLYPWALVKKEGRTMTDPVSVYMIERGDTVRVAQGGGGMAFAKRPAFRSRHGFADGTGGHTHTVVTRVEVRPRRGRGSSGGSNIKTSQGGRPGGKEEEEDCEETEVPCCLILRDPTDRDSFNLTIAPGIDPLLVICYLAVHARMDVEPILSDI